MVSKKLEELEVKLELAEETLVLYKKEVSKEKQEEIAHAILNSVRQPEQSTPELKEDKKELMPVDSNYQSGTSMS